MTIKDKMKTYNFWISLVSAILLVARIVANKFNFEIDSSLVMDITTGMCGIFVVLGIISAPQKTVTKIVNNDNDGSTTVDLSASGLVANEEVEITDKIHETCNNEEIEEQDEKIETEQFNGEEDINFDEELEDNRAINLQSSEIETATDEQQNLDNDLSQLENLTREELINIVLRIKNN